jgi:hypothetical protein
LRDLSKGGAFTAENEKVINRLLQAWIENGDVFLRPSNQSVSLNAEKKRASSHDIES